MRIQTYAFHNTNLQLDLSKLTIDSNNFKILYLNGKKGTIIFLNYVHNWFKKKSKIKIFINLNLFVFMIFYLYCVK